MVLTRKWLLYTYLDHAFAKIAIHRFLVNDTGGIKQMNKRRKLLKILVTMGGSAAVLPETWTKPVVKSVVLPAEAEILTPRCMVLTKVGTGH